MYKKHMYAKSKKKLSFRSSSAKPRKAAVGRPKSRAVAAAPSTAPAPGYSYSNPGAWGRHGREIGGAIGGAYGGPAGAALGSSIGGLAHYVGRLFGSGKYEVSQSVPKVNSLFTEAGSAKAPSISFGPGSVRIKHREYLCDVTSSGTAGQFSCQTFRLNPGIHTTFPWLSKVARGYQTYQFGGLVFEFKSASGEAMTGTNSALGTVIMSPDYNTAALSALEDFENKQEMMGQSGAVACKPSQSSLCGIECDPARMVLPRLYISDGDESHHDIRTSDPASFSIATSGLQGTNVVVGELHVIYDVVFFDPDLEPAGSSELSAVFVLDNTTAAGQAPGVINSGLFGAPANATKIYDNIGCYLGASAGSAAAMVVVKNRNRIPSGSVFHVEWVAIGTGTALVGAPNIASVPGVDTTEGGSGPMVEFPNVAATSTISAMSYYISIPDNTALDIATPAGIIVPALPGVETVPIIAITNSGVPGAVTSLPGSGVGSITQMRLTITQVNPRTRLGRSTFA